MKTHIYVWCGLLFHHVAYVTCKDLIELLQYSPNKKNELFLISSSSANKILFYVTCTCPCSLITMAENNIGGKDVAAYTVKKLASFVYGDLGVPILLLLEVSCRLQHKQYSCSPFLSLSLSLSLSLFFFFFFFSL